MLSVQHCITSLIKTALESDWLFLRLVVKLANEFVLFLKFGFTQVLYTTVPSPCCYRGLKNGYKTVENEALTTFSFSV